METVQLVLIGQGGELDKVEVTVKETDDCSREVLAAMAREKWVLSVGDRIEIQAKE